LSLASEPTATERVQATRFIDAFRLDAGGVERPVWRGTTRLAELIDLVARFVGRGRAEQDFAEYARERGLDLARIEHADAGFVQFAERLLAGAIGASSARVMIASTVRHESVGAEEVIAILDEASAVIEYSRQLEQKSQALERASSELRAANERLQELDRLKDEFLATVTHELRTPLTSIRSFSEILRDNADLPPEQRGEFLAIVIKESERLTRLINQVLDLAKIEADRYDWQIAAVDPRAVAEDALAATRRLFEERGVAVEIDLGVVPAVRADRDQVMQVAVNLLSNAAKFAPDRQGRVRFALRQVGGAAEFSVADNGPGIAPEHVPHVFEKFRQFTDQRAGKPQGTGLGLAICRRIVEHLGGRIAVESRPGSGAQFIFTVPLA
jgi:signal transduction histidine kinase